FSAHEALDRSHLVTAFFSDFVADHPFVQNHPKLKREAERLSEAMAGFYQAVGQIVFASELWTKHEPSTPNELAAELKISPKTLRAFLRKNFPRDKSARRLHWQLTSAQIAAARQRWGRERGMKNEE